jgi:hypothetical protein
MYIYIGQIKWTNRPFLSLDKKTIMNYTIIIFDTKVNFILYLFSFLTEEVS